VEAAFCPVIQPKQGFFWSKSIMSDKNAHINNNQRAYDSMTNRNFDSQVAHDTFPHFTKKGIVKSTIANLRYLFKVYGIEYEYDEILKKQTIILNDGGHDGDLSENSIKSHICSLLALNDMPLATAKLISALLNENTVNPVLDFIKSKNWDGVDRLPDLYNTLDVEPEHYRYRELAVKTWLVQCVAAADAAKSSPIPEAAAKFELVLVLQGKQGLGKTTWFRSLLPKELGRYIVDGAFLDPANKDSRIEATSCWICELGELDATFRKADISRLKAFLSNSVDRMRLPYDSVTSHFSRRTSYCGTVNPEDFLTDPTGSRRIMPLAINNCYPLYNEDMQQVWAQVWYLYLQGAQWWANEELEQLAVQHHEHHEEVNPIAELISEHFNLAESQRSPASASFFDFRHYTITQLLIECGVNMPSKEQIKVAKATLERRGFAQSMSVKGIRGYWLVKLIFNNGVDNFDNSVAVPVPVPDADPFLKIDMPEAVKYGVTVRDYRRLLTLSKSKRLTMGKISTMYKNKFNGDFDALEKFLNK
jgi:putative DNA primase/helicase